MDEDKCQRNNMLTREECVDIYTYNTYGRRLVETLPDLGLRAGRDIFIPDAPAEAVTAFEEQASLMKLDERVHLLAIHARIFGYSSYFVAINEVEMDRLPTRQEVHNYKIEINILDPIKTSSTRMELDPFKTGFMNFEDLRIEGRQVHAGRGGVYINGIPIFNRFTSSTYNFSGVSVFQNIYTILDIYEKNLDAIERVIGKASALVIKRDRGTVDTLLNRSSDMHFAQMVNDLKTYGVIGVNSTDTVDWFGLGDVEGFLATMEVITNSIAAGVYDIPSSIVKDQKLSNGMSEGAEDMKSILMLIDNFRRGFYNIYKKLDYYVMAKAWNDDFLESIRATMPEYEKYTTTELFSLFRESFSFKFKNPYPQTKKEEIQEKEGMLKLYASARNDLGADLEEIEKSLVEDKMFPNPLILKSNNIKSNDYGKF